jgi:hypothetical protein
MNIFLIINFIIGGLACIVALSATSTMVSMGYNVKKTDGNAKLYYRIKLILMLLMPVINLIILLGFVLIPIDTLIKWNLEAGNIEERV